MRWSPRDWYPPPPSWPVEKQERQVIVRRFCHCHTWPCRWNVESTPPTRASCEHNSFVFCLVASCESPRASSTTGNLRGSFQTRTFCFPLWQSFVSAAVVALNLLLLVKWACPMVVPRLCDRFAQNRHSTTHNTLNNTSLVARMTWDIASVTKWRNAITNATDLKLILVMMKLWNGCHRLLYCTTITTIMAGCRERFVGGCNLIFWNALQSIMFVWTKYVHERRNLCVLPRQKFCEAFLMVSYQGNGRFYLPPNELKPRPS